MSLLEKFYSGDVKSLSRLISFAENRTDGYQELISELYPRTGRAYKLGITGPPGAGKSTLVDALASLIVKDKQSVGIIAVDPSSPFTGGAFLGDRVRMQSAGQKEGVYIRSMASRGSAGGVSSSTYEACLILDAFGKDFIILETVGVGQIELEIAQHSDTTVIVLSPESGDSIQAFKAGLMEIGDIFAVNKADREGASRLVVQLNMGLETKRKTSTWHYPVTSTVGTTGGGIENLLEEIKKHHKHQLSTSQYALKRRGQIKNQLQRVLESRLREEIALKLGSNLNWDSWVEDVYQKKESPYTVAEKILGSTSN